LEAGEEENLLMPTQRAADNIKLAKMLRILGFLTQTKVYLFWKKQINCPLADKKNQL
jgi:hypothetical protein